MVKVGSLFVCDRCGKEYFYENDWRTTDVTNVEGWIMQNKSNDIGDCKDLCPDCADDYKRLMASFYNAYLTEET